MPLRETIIEVKKLAFAKKENGKTFDEKEKGKELS